MLPYPFNNIHYQVIGEFENSLRIVFYADAESHLLVYEHNCFYLVNKPAHLNLNGYYTANFSNKSQTENYCILEILEQVQLENPCVYILLEDAVIKIAMHFSTGDGQLVEDFSIFRKAQEQESYEQLLQKLKATKPIKITDLRFT